MESYPVHSRDDEARVRRACRTWPASQQERWIALMAPEFGEPEWKPVTQTQCASVYSRYLAAGEPLTPDGVRRWIAELERRGITPRTISGYMWAIQRVVSKVTDDPISWLTATCVRAQTIADQTPKRKLASIVPAEAVLQFGLETIARAKAMGPSTWKAVQLYRDGLVLVYGLHAPERRRALATTRLDDVNLAEGLVAYSPEQIKTGTPSTRAIPAIVTALLREWIDMWRAQYVRAPDHGSLLIAKGGGPAAAAAVYAAMRTLTANAPWGFPISPHRLRDAVATSLVEISPETARLASIVLGHTSERMTRNYTETAKRIEASRQGRRLLTQGRDDAAKRAREVSAGEGTLLLNPRARARRR